MKSLISLLFVITLSITSTYADECRDAVEYQSMDILAHELNVSYDEVYNEYQIMLTKTQELIDGVEKYEAYFNTYSGVFTVKMDVNYFCDVIKSETTPN